MDERATRLSHSWFLRRARQMSCHTTPIMKRKTELKRGRGQFLLRRFHHYRPSIIPVFPLLIPELRIV
jgi:hypothetical protein